MNNCPMALQPTYLRAVRRPGQRVARGRGQGVPFRLSQFLLCIIQPVYIILLSIVRLQIKREPHLHQEHQIRRYTV